MTIYKEKAGVICKESCWICFDRSWMYTGDTLLGLFKDMWIYWQDDSRLVGCD